MQHRLAILSAAAVLAACAHTLPTPVPPQLRPAGEHLAFTLAARGVQVYECRAKKDAAGQYEWAFVAPEAELFDARGAAAGKHYAGPHWEALDGSKTLGSVAARADAPNGSIPWLLLTTRPAGGAGAFANVTSIQRVNTTGGLAPAGGCGAANTGAVARVPYTADYNFLMR